MPCRGSALVLLALVALLLMLLVPAPFVFPVLLWSLAPGVTPGSISRGRRQPREMPPGRRGRAGFRCEVCGGNGATGVGGPLVRSLKLTAYRILGVALDRVELLAAPSFYGGLGAAERCQALGTEQDLGSPVRCVGDGGEGVHQRLCGGVRATGVAGRVGVGHGDDALDRLSHGPKLAALPELLDRCQPGR